MTTTKELAMLETAPIGTRAPAIGGGHWYRTASGWKWNGPDGTGSTFPRPGADWNGSLILATPEQFTPTGSPQESETVDAAVMLAERALWQDDAGVRWVPEAAYQRMVSEVERLESIAYPLTTPEPDAAGDAGLREFREEMDAGGKPTGYLLLGLCETCKGHGDCPDCGASFTPYGITSRDLFASNVRSALGKHYDADAGLICSIAFEHFHVSRVHGRRIELAVTAYSALIWRTTRLRWKKAMQGLTGAGYTVTEKPTATHEQGAAP